MARIDLRRALSIFCITFVAGAAAFHFNVVGHTAYAVERAVMGAIDEQLPTVSEMEALARANRLVARKAVPAVVHILSTTRREMDLPPEDEIPEWLQTRPGWDRFSEEEQKEIWREQRRELLRRGGRRSLGQGSGVIIDARKGLILTNYHVAGEADSIEVRLNDGRRFEATLVGKDRPTDLAVVKIEADQLFELAIGDSERLQVGDPVMTIGNPFGNFNGSVSKGIVSAMDRSQVGIIDYEGFIQTDAVINPGNSGGPMVNMRAEIVGINTAIESTTGSFNGIGLAIPSSRVNRVLPTLLKGEQVVRGYLGVQIGNVQDDTDVHERLAWNERHGVIIDRVVPNSPAAEAGFREHDILVNMDGDPIDSSTHLTEHIAYTSPGEKLVFDVWRNERMVSLQAVIGRQPYGFSTRPTRFRRGNGAPPEPVEDGADLATLGFEVETLDRQLAETYHLQGVAAEGVVVTHVNPDCDARVKNVKPGDLIVAVNGNSVSNIAELETVLKYVSTTEAVDLRLRNRKGSRHVQLDVAE